MRRIWRHSTAVPKELMLEKSRRVSAIQPIWLAAKQANDFAPFGAAFAELMPLYREVAQAKGEALGLNPFDALMDEFDPGLGTRSEERRVGKEGVRTCRSRWSPEQ